MCECVYYTVINYSSYDHQVQHYQIQRDSRDWVTADGDEYFENLVKLVEVHNTLINRIVY